MSRTTSWRGVLQPYVFTLCSFLFRVSHDPRHRGTVAELRAKRKTELSILREAETHSAPVALRSTAVVAVKLGITNRTTVAAATAAMRARRELSGDLQWIIFFKQRHWRLCEFESVSALSFAVKP